LGEVVCAFLRGEAAEEISDGVPEGLTAAGCSLADQRLEFGEGLLDRIEIGAVGRQVDQTGAARFNGFAHAGDLVRAEIVLDDDVTGCERGGQDLFAIGAKGIAIHGAIENEWRAEPGRSQPGDQGRCPPMPVRNRGNKRWPRWQRPRSRVMFVVAQLSSMKT